MSNTSKKKNAANTKKKQTRSSISATEKNNVKKENGNCLEELEKTRSKLSSVETTLIKMEEENKELKKDIQALKEQNSEYQSLIHKLEERVQEFDAQQKDQEFINSPYSTFNIEIYPGDKGFRGKIINIQSEDNQTFTNIDPLRITQFIYRHLPKEEEIKIPGQPVPEPVETIEKVPGGQATQTIKCRLQTYPVYEKKPRRALEKQQSFQVGILIDFSGDTEGLPPELLANIIVFARSLDTGHTVKIAEEQKAISLISPKEVKIKCEGLPEGTYRLETSIGFSSVQGEKVPISAFTESEYIRIY